MGVITVFIRGNVKLRTPAAKKQVSNEFFADLDPTHTEEVVDKHSPSHTLLTLDGREDLSRVLESDGAFTKRVGNREEVDEAAKNFESAFARFFSSAHNLQDNRTDLSGTLADWDVGFAIWAVVQAQKRQPSCQQENTHKWERLRRSQHKSTPQQRSR